MINDLKETNANLRIDHCVVFYIWRPHGREACKEPATLLPPLLSQKKVLALLQKYLETHVKRPGFGCIVRMPFENLCRVEGV